jgi:tryptophan synthase beta chain
MPGVLHGSKSYLLQDEDGQISPSHSISAGLDYPGVGPEHSYLKETGRAEYVSVTDDEAMEGFKLLAHSEGLIPALEPSHAVAHLSKVARGFGPEQVVILNLSGRGDKDVDTARKELNID